MGCGCSGGAGVVLSAVLTGLVWFDRDGDGVGLGTSTVFGRGRRGRGEGVSVARTLFWSVLRLGRQREVADHGGLNGAGGGAGVCPSFGRSG